MKQSKRKRRALVTICFYFTQFVNCKVHVFFLVSSLVLSHAFLDFLSHSFLSRLSSITQKPQHEDNFKQPLQQWIQQLIARKMHVSNRLTIWQYEGANRLGIKIEKITCLKENEQTLYTWLYIYGLRTLIIIICLKVVKWNSMIKV